MMQSSQTPIVPALRTDVRFILAAARALHTAGTTAQRLEDSLAVLARRIGLTNPQFFSTPTSIMCAFGEPEHQEVHLLRLSPAGPNIGRLSKLDRVVTGVLEGTRTRDEALADLEAIQREPSPYSPLVTILAFGLASAGIARILGGGITEIAVGAFLGILTGMLESAAERVRRLEQVFEPTAAFLAAFIAAAIASLLGPYAHSTAVLAGIVVLLPGLTLTNGVRELAERHLASGTARLAGAAMVLVGLTFGVALGDRMAAMLFGEVQLVQPAPLPWWTVAASLIATGLGFVVILKAERRDVGWILLASAMSYGFSSVAVPFAQAELGLFVAAMFNGIGAIIWSRWRNRPQSVVLVPGILMLVPGSMGFRSLNSLLDRDVISGVQTAFAMMLAATALSAGLLMSGLFLSGRRRSVPGGQVMLTGEYRANP